MGAEQAFSKSRYARDGEYVLPIKIDNPYGNMNQVLKEESRMGERSRSFYKKSDVYSKIFGENVDVSQRE